jgi:hypothetical protein
VQKNKKPEKEPSVLIKENKTKKKVVIRRYPIK